MKRDMELVRKILLFMESRDSDEECETTFEGFTNEQVDFHARIMYEAGLITAIEAGTRANPLRVIPRYITWEGYEFIDNARDDRIWKEAKDRLGKKVSSASFSVLTNVLSNVVTWYITKDA